MASKKKDWTELLGNKAPTEEQASSEPGTPPTTVLMHTIVGNPENPRSEGDYTDEDPEFVELKASMREVGQLQPLAVLPRAVFERVKPGFTKQLGTAEWVTVTGNRRLAAARQLGWTRIDIRVNDRIGDDEGKVDEAVIIENIHRKNIAPIREAEFLQRMVDRHGSQEKVAERIGKSQMYVSHRLALLNLAPDIREQVDAGTIKLKQARQLGRIKDHDEQRAKLEAATAEPAESPVQNPVLKPADVPAALEDAPALAPAAPSRTEGTPRQQATASPGPQESFTAVKLDPPPPLRELPVPRAESGMPAPEPEPEKPRVGLMPWDNGAAAMDIMFGKLDEEQRRMAIGRYLALLGGPAEFAADLKDTVPAAYRKELAGLLLEDV